MIQGVRGELIAQAYAALDAGDVSPLVALLDPEVRWIGVGDGWSETPSYENRVEVVDLLQRYVANGRRFAVSDYLESGDRVAVTLTISGPPIPPVDVTEIFTFRSDTNVVIQMNDGFDELSHPD
jgi:ketosteroid isomerase-like protein